MAKKPFSISRSAARRIWLRAQRLDELTPFGSGPAAVPAAIEHLGYVQIDTISVIERCHHHILFSRIPDYRREHLSQAQVSDKSVFEYWTHALAYVPARDLPFFLPAMQQFRETPSRWFGSVAPDEVKKMLKRIRADGPISMRDIDDDELVDKTHPWASKKPSKRVLEMMFYQGHVTIGSRAGMLKTYDLIERHFDWQGKPKPATARQVIAYQLDRALRAQGIVSLDSICHLTPSSKKPVKELIESRVRTKKLVPVLIEGSEVQHWAAPDTLDAIPADAPTLIHILSPFDPLIIQRKRLNLFFGYDHIFEAYVPAARRKFGYFTLPVLAGEQIIAAIDLKADRAARSLLVQKLTWLEDETAERRALLDTALERFAAFQFDN
ncbi:DNA glycosylase AlkZ-like family protein [Devosia sp.]|uniref:winged helix-turn-helix domain-containing protein n=1 Tax=Devosia sp. TaxID=1871048 RepID=UPI003266F4D3